MWHWDQGHLAYFQFEALRRIAAFVQSHDFKQASRETLQAAIGLPFSVPADYTPWRNYSRTLKLSLLVSEVNNRAQATPAAAILARPGAVTSDEYFHFIARAFTEPAPALQDWRRDAEFRYPLLFALKYLLTKTGISNRPFASFDEIIGAYSVSGFAGVEGTEEFIRIVGRDEQYARTGNRVQENLRRQARESLKVIAQISYLHPRGSRIMVLLNAVDARQFFEELAPIIGPRANDRESEIRRLADLFIDGSTDIVFDYPNTIVDEIVASGFREGGKSRKTHVTIERNAILRREFFLARPTSTCDICGLDTSRTYPWTQGVLDLHHLLPLSSGTRVEEEGTTFDDLVPVCPNCHRAIHRYYDGWLNQNGRQDFIDAGEARTVDRAMKDEFQGLVHA
jgi:hypothetical protein